MNCISLNNNWTVKGNMSDGTPVEIGADAPCTVHSAMMEAGIIKDLYYGKNADDWMWIEEKKWYFEKSFTYDMHSGVKCVELEFEGLDTYCNISLNGKKIAFCDDFYVTHTFDVTGIIKNGLNTISIEFIPHGEQTKDIDYGDCTGVFSSDRIFVRRMQCTFGWDWVHRLVTVGIWKNVNLYTNRYVRIDCLQATLSGLTHAGAHMELSLFADVKKQFFFDTYARYSQHYSAAPMAEFCVKAPEGECIWKSKKLLREAEHTEYITITNPQLWYPNGYGESPLYTLSAVITGENGDEIISKEIKFGIRNVQIAEIADVPDTDSYELACSQHIKFTQEKPEKSDSVSFIPVVNDVKIMCKGGNWVPADPFPGNVSPGKLEELIRIAHDGGINMLRVWGGGYFESDEFYSLCDRYGIMVQQDFMMACGEYPYDDEYLERHNEADKHFTEQLQTECEQNVARICHHPCIVWYNGDNENQMDYNADYINASRRLAFEITYPSIRKYDRIRRFMPSSPTRGSKFNSPACGLFHATGFLDFYFKVLRETDMKDYIRNFGDAVARFSNETPVMSGISEFSLRKFTGKKDLELCEKEVLDYHTKNHPAPEYRDFHLFDHMMAGAKKLFGEFTDVSDRIYKLNLLGFEWTRVIMESYRKNKWYTAGNLFWMYNDCWPAVGWSMVDFYCNPKCGYYAMKKCCKPICSSIDFSNSKISVHISNDGTEAATGKGKLRLIDCRGNITESYEFKVESEANGVMCAFTVEKAGFAPDGTSVWICDVETDIGCDRSFFFGVKPCEMKFEKADIKVSRKENTIILKSDKTAFYVTLDGEYKFEDNCFILLPGEEKSISIEKTMFNESDDIKLYWMNR